jgi:transcription elongation GreA/GreB family factor
MKHTNRNAQEVSEGSKVFLQNRTHSLRFRLVESIYSLEEEQISIDSPIGKAVIGKRTGDRIAVTTPKGVISYSIKEIE